MGLTVNLKSLYILTAWLFITQTLRAQHHNAWLRGTLSISLNKKIKTDSELQYRRQNGFGNNDMLNKNLMFTFRNWTHYQYNKEIRFSVSPFALFSHYRIIQRPEDETARPVTEIRFSAAADIQQRFFDKFYLTGRSAVEYRIFNNSQADITRFRNRLGIRFEFQERFKLSLYDEILVNATGVSLLHFYDHNRVGLSLEYQISDRLKSDFGYVYISRLPTTATDRLNENNIFVNLSYLLKKR